MPRPIDVLRLAVLLIVCGVAVPAGGTSALIEEEAPIAVDIHGRRLWLDAVVVRPTASLGPWPLALVTHGSPRDPAVRPTFRARTLLPQARDLAHRGWLTIAFARRGFGSSQGGFVEGYTCASPDFRRALATAAEDIAAAHRTAVMRPDVDRGRVLGMGVSVGGAAMLAWSTTRPEGLAGIVNVSGGTGSSTQKKNCDETRLIEAFAAFGGRSTAPSLWLYAKNDSYFDADLVQRLHASFRSAGADATLRMFGPVGKDGHEIWRSFAGRSLWLPALDRFLRERGLPTWSSAPLDTVSVGLRPDARRVFASYLEAPAEKALAVSRANGIARFWSGESDLDTARRKSRELCERDSGEACDVRVEDFLPATTP